MELFLFAISYIILDILGSLGYVAILLFFVFMMKRMFHMNESKWTSVFEWKDGKGMFAFLLVPYLLMLLMLFPLSVTGFTWIGFEHRYLSSVIVMVILTLTMIVKLPRLKKCLP